MSRYDHKLLLDEPVIALNRRVARELGPEAALVLQQLHFRTVAGTSDSSGHWLVVEREARRWVTWSVEGRSYDIPLGKPGKSGGDAAFRRVIEQLERDGLILVKQIQKSAWNRSNFYSIDYDAFSERFHSVESPVSPLRTEDFNESISTLSKRSKPTLKPALVRKEVEKEAERVHDSADASLWSILDQFVSRKPGDDVALDRKKLVAAERLCKLHNIGVAELAGIVDLSQSLYAGQLLAAIQVSINTKEKAAQQQKSEATAASNEHDQRAVRQVILAREKQAQTMLDTADAAQLEALSAYAQETSPPVLRQRVAECVISRQLGAPPCRVSVVKAVLGFVSRANAHQVQTSPVACENDMRH